MADNYLERKMEELRSGKLGSAAAHSYASKRRALCYPIRELRVLIVARNRKFLRQYDAVFRSAGCRVAVINTISANDTDLGESHGARYYETVGPEDVAAAIDSLAKAWRDIDVVVMLDDVAGLLSALRAMQTRLPYPNAWGTPILQVACEIVKRFNNARNLNGDVVSLPDEPQRKEAGVLPWLSLNSNKSITTITISEQ